MEVFKIDRKNKLPWLEINCATIGNFDGVHLGHQQLINRTKEKGFKSLVLTFDCLTKDTVEIISLEEKISYLSEFNIDYLLILDFEYYKKYFYDEFIKMLKELKTKKIIVGTDFKFGYKQEGDIIDLLKHFEVDVVEDVYIDNEKVSSSFIREYLTNGNVKQANKMLGYNYFMEGEVIRGNQQGRTIGFPTANICYHNLILKSGVYKTRTYYNGVWYKSMTNVGFNPTINLQTNLRVETHIIDFDFEIYGNHIKIEFIDWIREEQCFSTKECLLESLKDCLLICKK